jgi:hypothetical protein
VRLGELTEQYHTPMTRGYSAIPTGCARRPSLASPIRGRCPGGDTGQHAVALASGPRRFGTGAAPAITIDANHSAHGTGTATTALMPGRHGGRSWAKRRRRRGHRDHARPLSTAPAVAARPASLTTGVFHWRSNTQPTNAAHPANITTSIDCPPCRARWVRCHA